MGIVAARPVLMVPIEPNHLRSAASGGANVRPDGSLPADSDRVSPSPQSLIKAMSTQLNTLFGGKRSDLAEPLQERFAQITRNLLDRFERGELGREQLVSKLNDEFTLLARDATELLGVPAIWPQEVATVIYPLMPKLVLRPSSTPPSPRIPVGEQAAYRTILSSAGSPQGNKLSVEV